MPAEACMPWCMMDPDMDVMGCCMWPPCMAAMAMPMGGFGPPAAKWPWAMDVLAVEVGAPEEPGV